jgi:predicted lactoylglutathione lyase
MTTTTRTTTTRGTSASDTWRHRMIFVNLPVADVARSRAFFTQVGYAFDERMCNGSALAVELGPNIYAMLLQREYFAQFHDGTVAEGGRTEVLTCLSADSREHVDSLVDAAVAAGGRDVRTEDYGGSDFMYGRSYADLDGHIWEIMWMDVAAAERSGVFG